MKGNNHYEYVIIGGGPAGLQAAYELSKTNSKYLLLEKENTPGAFFRQFPRHRQLISINKVFTGYEDEEINLRWDWNSLLTDDHDRHLFKDYSHKYFPTADTIVDYLSDYSKRFNLCVRLCADVEEISRENSSAPFQIRIGSDETISTDVVIVATGLSKPWTPAIPGIDTVESYFDMNLDMKRYENKKVLIIGKGNSAFETGDALIDYANSIHICSPNSLKFAWSTHYVGHLRAVNNNILDTYQLKSQNAVLDAEIECIKKTPDGRYRVTFAYEHAENEVETMEYDYVIACTGFRFDDSMFDASCLPSLCERRKFPAQNSNWESTNVPDMYFAGTISQYRDYRKYMSGFIHGFRYNVRSMVNLLQEKYAGTAYPSSDISNDPESVADYLIRRINKTSALWQQPGFLADIAILPDDRSFIKYIEELPVDYIHERVADTGAHYFIISLEFGKTKFENPFNVPRISRDNVSQAENSNFLHPIVRHYQHGNLISEHHVIENLHGEWLRPEHRNPLISYLENELTPGSISTPQESVRSATYGSVINHVGT